MRKTMRVGVALGVLACMGACQAFDSDTGRRDADLGTSDVPIAADVPGTDVPAADVPQSDLPIPSDAPAPDAPIADVPLASTALLGGGTSYGECVGQCVRNVTIVGSVVHFRITGNDAMLYTDQPGTLTEAGRAKADGIAAALVGVLLQDVYGCPGCADGGVSRVDLSREGVASSPTYGTGSAPGALVPADSMIQDLMVALKECTATVDVTPDPDCHAFFD